MSENDTSMETIAPHEKEDTTKDSVSSKLTNGDNAPKSPTLNGKSTENDEQDTKNGDTSEDATTIEDTVKTKDDKVEDKVKEVKNDDIEKTDKKNGDGESNQSKNVPEKADEEDKEVKDETKESDKDADDKTEDAKTNGKDSLEKEGEESADKTGTEETSKEDGVEDSDSPKKKPKKKAPALDDTPTRRSSRARKPVSYVDEVKIVPEAMKSAQTKSQDDVVVIDGEKKNVIVIDTNTLMRNQGNLSLMVGQKTQAATTTNTQSPLQQLNQQLISNSITLTQHPSSSVTVTKSSASSTPSAQTNSPKTLTPQQLLQSAIQNVSNIGSSINLGGVNQTAAAIANNPAALQNAIAAITGGGNAPPGLKNAYITAVQQVLIQQQTAATNTTPAGQAYLSNLQQYYNTLGALQDEAYVIEAPSFIVPYVMEGKPKESIKDFLKKMNAEANKEEKKNKEEKQESDKEKEETSKKDAEEKENSKEDKESKSDAEEVSKDEKKKSEDNNEDKDTEKESEEKMDVDEEEKSSEKTEETKEKDAQKETDDDELKEEDKEENETKEKENETKKKENETKQKENETKKKEENETVKKEKEEDEAKEKEEDDDEEIKSKKTDDSEDKIETKDDKSEEKEKMEVDEEDKENEKDEDKEKKDDEEEVKKNDKKFEAKEYSDTEDMTKDDYTHLGRWEGYYKSTLGQFMMDLGLSQAREFIQADLLKMQKRKLDKMKTAPSRQDVNAVKSLDRQLSKSRAKNAHLKLETKVCKFCNYKTDSKLVMDRHLESPHMVNYTYKCNYCNFETRGPQVILFHMEAEHMVRGRLERAPAFFQCQLCPFEDNNKSKMTRHSFSCAKKFKPERNCDLSDWEPPAKIPKQMTRGRNIPMASNSNLKNMMANMGNSLYEGAARNLLPKGLPANLNLQQLQAAVAQGLLPSPSSANAANSGNRGRPIGSYKANLVGGNNSTSRTGPFNKAGGSLTQAQQLALAGQLFQNVQGNKGKGGSTPSISITPLPRSGATSGGKVPTSKDGKPSFVICEICDGYIKDLEQLRNHMNFIHKVKIHPKMIYNRPPLNCQKCQQRFFTDQGLERHLLGTHGLVTSSMQEAANKSKDAGRCPICGKVFQWKLLNHVARDHKMTLKPAHLSYKCTVCTATFNMYRLFENHVYSAHSVVNKNKEASKTNGSSDVPLKINDEITIIPQPSGNKSMQRFSEKKDTSSITAGVNKEITITKVGSTSVSRNGSSKSSVEVISLDESPQKRGLKRSSESNGAILAGPSKKARD